MRPRTSAGQRAVRDADSTPSGRRYAGPSSDLYQPNWLPKQFAPFDAAVSSICLHNLRDFTRIGQIYREIREHLTPGGIFLNLDLVNAPSAELSARYDVVTASRRQRAGESADRIEAMVRGRGRSAGDATMGPFSATVAQHLVALKSAGFKDVDCFWKELRRALVGGYA